MNAGDDMAEFAIDFLLSGRGSARHLAFVLAKQWPDQPALGVVYALSVAANSIEQVLTGAEVAKLSQEAWCMAGLIGVDLYVAQTDGLPCTRAADLLAYWQAHDPFFMIADELP